MACKHGTIQGYYSTSDLLSYPGKIDIGNENNFLAAIEASLLDSNDNKIKDIVNYSTSEDVVKPLEEKNLQTDGNSVEIIINRKSVSSTTVRAINRKKFSFYKPLIVTLAGEDAVDVGEFFRLLMSAIRDSEIFHSS